MSYCCLDSQKLGFWDNRSSISDVDPQAVSEQQQLVPLPIVGSQSVCTATLDRQSQKVQFDIWRIRHTSDMKPPDCKALVRACMLLGQMKNPDFNVEAGFLHPDFPPLKLGKCVRCLCVTRNWPNQLRTNN